MWENPVLVTKPKYIHVKSRHLNADCVVADIIGRFNLELIAILFCINPI